MKELILGYIKGSISYYFVIERCVISNHKPSSLSRYYSSGSPLSNYYSSGRLPVFSYRFLLYTVTVSQPMATKTDPSRLTVVSGGGI